MMNGGHFGFLWLTLFSQNDPKGRFLNNVVITTVIEIVETVEILDGRLGKRSVERVRYVINNLLHLVIVKYGVISLVLSSVHANFGACITNWSIVPQTCNNLPHYKEDVHYYIDFVLYEVQRHLASHSCLDISMLIKIYNIPFQGCHYRPIILLKLHPTSFKTKTKKIFFLYLAEPL